MSRHVEALTADREDAILYTIREARVSWHITLRHGGKMK